MLCTTRGYQGDTAVRGHPPPAPRRSGHRPGHLLRRLGHGGNFRDLVAVRGAACSDGVEPAVRGGRRGQQDQDCDAATSAGWKGHPRRSAVTNNHSRVEQRGEEQSRTEGGYCLYGAVRVGCEGGWNGPTSHRPGPARLAVVGL